MWANSARFVPWTDRKWDDWRTAEKDSDAIVRYCAECGFAHHQHNHAPTRERARSVLRDVTH